MSSSLDVGVAILTWNSENDIVACLDSLIGQPVSHIVVVDNGSSDSTVELIRAHSLDVDLIRQQTNTGFAAASNRALSHLTNEFKLCLNDDAILTPGYVDLLVGELQKHPNAASATGKLLSSSEPGSCIDSAGIAINFHRLSPLDRGHLEPDDAQYDNDDFIFGPSAAAAVYRGAALAALSEPPFDESLFAYYEDVDLAWRLNNLGWVHLYRPKAVAYHFRRGPDSKPCDIRAQAFANRYVVWAKNQSFRDFMLYSPLAVPWELSRVARRFFSEPALLARVPVALKRSLSIILSRVRD